VIDGLEWLGLGFENRASKGSVILHAVAVETVDWRRWKDRLEMIKLLLFLGLKWWSFSTSFDRVLILAEQTRYYGVRLLVNRREEAVWVELGPKLLNICNVPFNSSDATDCVVDESNNDSLNVGHMENAARLVFTWLGMFMR
jgi:hypothetical protein